MTDEERKQRLAELRERISSYSEVWGEVHALEAVVLDAIVQLEYENERIVNILDRLTTVSRLGAD